MAIKLKTDDFQWLLTHLPAYGMLNDVDRVRHMQMFALLNGNMPKVVGFVLPRAKNQDFGLAVPCIKFIRSLTGWGLKEAKDAYDSDTVIQLSTVKKSKAMVDDTLAAMFSGQVMPIIEWVES